MNQDLHLNEALYTVSLETSQKYRLLLLAYLNLIQSIACNHAIILLTKISFDSCSGIY